MSDAVDHPTHYNSHPSGVEAIVICEHHNFNVGNAIKYLWRAGLKTESPVEDLKKAAWYVARELWRLTKKPDGEELLRSERDALRRGLDVKDAELADYERTVVTLREQLRAEEARRASYQAQAAVAMRVYNRAFGIDLSQAASVSLKLSRETWNALVSACRGD